MQCDNHSWDFHAQMLDNTTIRWCGRCGGIQTLIPTNAQKRILGLEEECNFSEVLIPSIVKDDDGLFSEGLVDDFMAVRDVYSGTKWSRFQTAWKPDGEDKLVPAPKVEDSVEYDPERLKKFKELQVLSGLIKESVYKGK